MHWVKHKAENFAPLLNGTLLSSKHTHVTGQGSKQNNAVGIATPTNVSAVEATGQSQYIE